MKTKTWRRACAFTAATMLAVGPGAGGARAGLLDFLKTAGVGKPAPEFRARLLDGRTIRLADFKGQVLVVNFWATWCGPCRQELPLLDAYAHIQAPHGLAVIAVTTESDVPDRQMRPLAKALHIPLATNFSGPYGLDGNAVPTNFVIDRAGVVRYAEAGAFTLDTLNKVLVPLLKEPAPQPSSEGPAVAAGASGAPSKPSPASPS